MSIDSVEGYIGKFQQPILNYESQTPTMFVLADDSCNELDLVLLTPGTFPWSYDIIKRINPKSVRLFVPTIREEFISDIFNLFTALSALIPTVKWVFPDKVSHSTFYNGQIVSMSYINEHNSNLSITYIENENVENVYDLVVKNDNGTHYFSQHLTKEKLDKLFDEYNIDYIHITTSNSIYGGLTYLDILNDGERKYLNKIIPHSYSSMDEYYYITKKEGVY